ncbi:hypothetical protein ACU8KH_00471 [Lachancea thermotolerans]
MSDFFILVSAKPDPLTHRVLSGSTATRSVCLFFLLYVKSCFEHFPYVRPNSQFLRPCIDDSASINSIKNVSGSLFEYFWQPLRLSHSIGGDTELRARSTRPAYDSDFKAFGHSHFALDLTAFLKLRTITSLMNFKCSPLAPRRKPDHLRSHLIALLSFSA